MIGLLTLSESLLCQKAVLGKIYECEIDGIKVQLHFPVFPVIDEKQRRIGISNPLVSPQIAKHLKYSEELCYWGVPMSYPYGNSLIKALAVSVECDKESVNEYACRLYESIEKWESSFLAYLMLVTKQGLYRNINVERNTCRLMLIDDKYIPNHLTIEISANIPAAETFASNEQIQNAIAFANTGKDLLLEYSMLLSAYSAIKQNQKRRAIMDACAALEIVLAKQIDKNKGIIEQMPEGPVCENFSLGDKIKLLRKIDKSLPGKDYDKLVVNPRNGLMHGRIIIPTDETTNTIISCVEDLLNHFNSTYY